MSAVGFPMYRGVGSTSLSDILDRYVSRYVDREKEMEFDAETDPDRIYELFGEDADARAVKVWVSQMWISPAEDPLILFARSNR